MVDDAFISFRYAKNFAQGYGLVYNPGEAPVEGYTNFLWTLINSIPHTFGIDVIAFAKVTGVIFGISALLVLYFVARIIFRKQNLHVILAILFVVVSFSFNYWLVCGLETHIYTLSILLGIYFFLRFWDNHIAISLGLSWLLIYLNRPDGLLIILFMHIYYVFYSLKQRKNIFSKKYILSTAIFTSGFLLHIIWRLCYYGEIVPNTYFAKVSGLFGYNLNNGFTYVINFFTTYPITAILLITWVINRKDKYINLIYGLTILLLVYTVFVGGDIMAGYRFLVPTIPLFALIFINTLDKMTNAYTEKNIPVKETFVLRLATGFTIFSFAVIFVLLVFKANSIIPLYQNNPLIGVSITLLLIIISMRIIVETFSFEIDRIKNIFSYIIVFLVIFCQFLPFLFNSNLVSIIYSDMVVNSGKKVGEWIKNNTDKDITIAVNTAGAIPYYSERKTIDMLGLNDRTIARRKLTQQQKDMFRNSFGHIKGDGDYVLSKKPELITFGNSGGSINTKYLSDYECEENRYFRENYNIKSARIVSDTVRYIVPFVNNVSKPKRSFTFFEMGVSIEVVRTAFAMIMNSIDGNHVIDMEATSPIDFDGMFSSADVIQLPFTFIFYARNGTSLNELKDTKEDNIVSSGPDDEGSFSLNKQVRQEFIKSYNCTLNNYYDKAKYYLEKLLWAQPDNLFYLNNLVLLKSIIQYRNNEIEKAKYLLINRIKEIEKIKKDISNKIKKRKITIKEIKRLYGTISSVLYYTLSCYSIHEGQYDEAIKLLLKGYDSLIGNDKMPGEIDITKIYVLRNLNSKGFEKIHGQILSQFDQYRLFSKYKFLAALYRLSFIQNDKERASQYLSSLTKLVNLSEIKKDIPHLFHHDITDKEQLKDVIKNANVFWSLTYDFFPILSFN